MAKFLGIGIGGAVVIGLIAIIAFRSRICGSASKEGGKGIMTSLCTLSNKIPIGLPAAPPPPAGTPPPTLKSRFPTKPSATSYKQNPVAPAKSSLGYTLSRMAGAHDSSSWS